MDLTPETPDTSDGACDWLRSDWALALLLFLATAAVVLWQNSRLGVLWDLSYILENSYRISLGDVPYRDFPLPYAPLTFLTQAALIKLGGRAYFHHILYCAAMGGLATVLTWRTLLGILRGKLNSPRFVALLLSAPLIFLGIYCVYPHPFYDPDCTFAILLCLLLLQRLERKGFPARLAFLTGASLVIPLFTKQNTGIAFLGSVGLGLAVLIALEWRNRRRTAGYAWTIVGAAAGLLAALVLIFLTAGLANYIHWTIRFAASRRLPPLADMLGVYRNQALPWWIAAFIGGALLLVSSGKWINRTPALLSICFMSAPFAWPVIYLFLEEDSAERAERLLDLWPFLLITAFLFAILNLRRSSGVAMILPFVLIGTVHGAFLSQQLWGSTYALWPLLMLLLAGMIATLATHVRESNQWQINPFAAVAAVTMLVSGAFYVSSHERLDYVNLSEGQIARSTLPALRGLSVRGPWIPEFEELVRYADRDIPSDEGILMIPGEDLFYYATGRHPRFPVLMFDHTVNPYSADEILNLARKRDIRWLVVKRNLQIKTDPVENRDQLLNFLRQDFKPVKMLSNYDVYRRLSDQRLAGSWTDENYVSHSLSASCTVFVDCAALPASHPNFKSLQ